MKKTLAVVLIALLVVGMAFSAYALSGTVHHSIRFTGVRGLCTGYIKEPEDNNETKARITINLVAGESHLPPEDYSCKVSATIEYIVSGQPTILPLEKTGNLSAETGTFTTTNTVNSVDFDYYVNGVKKYHEAF